MYSDKENVNILTTLLVEYGVRHAVVCPGSRNAPIVHNLSETEQIICHPVTDERSAGFYALGMALQSSHPVVVCVTSGSALLNLAPAVAEAYYQQVPIIVVSADRPQAWIGQLDGQTIPQPDALGRFVRKAVSLPEPHNDEERWFANRLVNEALLEVSRSCAGPVHINVPISEPLYQFTVERLPQERVIQRYECDSDEQLAKQFFSHFQAKKRPLFVFGQMSHSVATNLINHLQEKGYVVLSESLSSGSGIGLLDEMMESIVGDDSFLPDMIIYMGGTLVSKRLKTWLRAQKDTIVCHIQTNREVEDVTTHLTAIYEGNPQSLLADIPPCDHREWTDKWWKKFQEIVQKTSQYHLAYSSLSSVKALAEKLQGKTYELFAANSMSIRWANRIFPHHAVHCNRGVNGIEGSLSAAAGYSLLSSLPVYVIIGDLSFFYDQNALWNGELKGNLRILLLNNNGGGIFSKFEGLKDSPVRESMVMAEHFTTAEGVCLQNHIAYRLAVDEEQLQAGIEWLVDERESTRPRLLEVHTDKEMEFVQ